MSQARQGRRLGVALAIAAALTAGVAAAEPQMRMLGDDRVMLTEFKGKPPFKRRVVQIEDLSPAQFARFEELRGAPAIDEARIGQQVRVVDFRGRPPFRRQIVEIDASNAATFARFEETAEQPQVTRPRTFNNRFPVRR